MGMLTRYQKPGGFIQLLQLIETCGKTKQDNFLQIIEKEDQKWADAIRSKMITIEKILNWNDNTIAEIAGRLHQLTLATALHGLKSNDGSKFMQMFTHTQRRNIDDLSKSKVPSALEINSAFLKILVEVRNMITQGYLRLDSVAPELIISKNIEEELGKTVVHKSSNRKNEAALDLHVKYESGTWSKPDARSEPSTTPAQIKPVHAASDIATLKTKIEILTKENQNLKLELKALKEKIVPAKKIA